MHTVQDAFFDRVYWEPAAASAQRISITSALGCCVVYDSTVHGSWPLIRQRTIDKCGTPPTVSENTWIETYISIRRAWLAGHPNPLLHKTVYRMVELGRLVGANNWVLGLPIVVRGVTIDQSVLDGGPVRVSAQVAEERMLLLRNPMMQGDDVRKLQAALNGKGAHLEEDGVFGSGTDDAVRQFQKRSGLTPDGVVGPATRSGLGL